MEQEKPNVTVVIVPRERFSVAIQSLESVLQTTKYPYDLVYVDGGYPDPVRGQIERASREHGFGLIRSDQYLTPNRARNLGFQAVETPYVVFIDNDVVVAPGWLEKLVECAEETGAAIVGPLYLIGRPEDRIIHMAGGSAGIREQGGERVMYEEHRFEDRNMDEVDDQLRREPTDLVEFHCMLIRSQVLTELGPLDEGLHSASEHLDISLLARQAGYQVYLEPESMVTYVTSGGFEGFDLPYYHLRWSDDWNQRSMARLQEKWNINDEYGTMMLRWLTAHRNLAPSQPT